MRFHDRSPGSGMAVLLFALLLGVVSTVPVFGAEALNYRYQLNEDKTLDYWFSKQGMRMDYREGESAYSILQPSDERALIALTHPKKEAVRLDQGFLERMVARMEQMRKKLQQLPERQRRMMEKSMGDAIASLEESDVSPPSIVGKTPTRWKDRPAVQGDVTTGGETVGTVVLLDDPPLPPNEDERRSIRNFQSLMENFLKVTGTVAASMGSEQLSGNRSFHLFGERQLRLAEFRSSEATIRLTEWNRREVADDFFAVPSDYSVKTPSQSMGPGSAGGTR